MASPVYQPIEPVRPTRPGLYTELTEAARNLGPAVGILSAAAAFTFLVPAMLTLAKIAHPAQPTQNVHPVALPKMPLVDVPVVDHRTAATPTTTELTTTSISSISSTTGPHPTHGGGTGSGTRQLDVELDFSLLGIDSQGGGMHQLEPMLRRSIAKKAEVSSRYVEVSTESKDSNELRVHAIVQPPEGRTPGDLRAMLVTLKPFLAQALHHWQGGQPVEVQPVQVSFIEAAKVESTEGPSPSPSPPVVEKSVTTSFGPRQKPAGRVAMMFVMDLHMKIKDLGAFDTEKYSEAFAEALDQKRSLVTVVKTEFRTEVEYLVPHLISQMQLRKALAEALRVPFFAVTVSDTMNSRRLGSEEAGSKELRACITTEDPSAAETYAEILKSPGEVMQAMRQQGLNALPLELRRKPWASVVLHTKLDLRGSPPKLEENFSSRLSSKLGVPVTADTLGIRQVLEEKLLGTGSDAVPPGFRDDTLVPPSASSSDPTDGSDTHGMPKPLPLTVAKVNYNNLLTSSHRFPPVLRYGHVGYVKHGANKVWLDAVLRVDGYQPKLHALTGEAHGAAALNVHTGSVSNLEISLVPSENIEVDHLKIHQIYLQISDIEDPPRLLGGEVTVKSCQEVIWPDGKTFHPSQDYTLPAGLAPQVLFDGLEAHVTLRAEQLEGNALGALWQGRTFFISLRSPGVVPAEEPSGGANGQDTKGLDLGYKMDLKRKKILYNNLGGLGPGHLDEPALLRFEKTCSIDDRPVDLVVSAPHGYRPVQPSLNGVHNGNVAVSVASGTSVDLRVLLTTASAQQVTPIMLSKLYMSIFDQEDETLSVGRAAVRGFEAVIFSNGTQVPNWKLKTEQHGVWVLPMGPKVTFLFRYVTKLVLTLAAPEGGCTFYISLHVPEAEAFRESRHHHIAAPGALPSPSETNHQGPHGFPQHLGRAFELRSRKVLYNNLASQGPSAGPPVIRYQNTCSKEGQNVDVVFHLVGRDYKPQLAKLNGLDGFYWAAPISVAVDSTLHLHLSFVTSKDTPVPFHELYLTIFDVEEPTMGITDDAVQVHDFEAVLWPDGTRTSFKELPKDWMPHKGPAPTYKLSSKQEISVILHGVRQPGNAVSSMWQGRSFFFSLHSPEAAPAVEVTTTLPAISSVTPAQVHAQMLDMGFPLALTEHNVVYNNLGGQGPGHLDDPLELRFADTASMRPDGSHGQRVDVVIEVHGEYQPANTAVNGAEKNRAVVSVRPGSSVHLEIRFLGAAVTEDPEGTHLPIALDSFICIEATGGEISSMTDAQEVVFLNGTRISKEVQHIPASDLPCFRFAGSDAHLILTAPKAGGGYELLSTEKAKGSAFYIAMLSPEVQAFHNVAASGSTSKLDFQTSSTAKDVQSFGKKMILSKTNVICNNLGGFGPDTNVPEQLHYRGTARLHHRAVDVVLQADPGYRPKKPLLNGLAGHEYAASVNVATNTEATIHLRFLAASHQVQESEALPVKFSKVFLSIFDSEEPIRSLGGEVLIKSNAKAAYWPNGTQMALIDPKTVWVVPTGLAPEILFEDIVEVTLTLKPKGYAGNSIGGFWAGRTFFITLHSPDLVKHPISSSLERGNEAHPQEMISSLGISLTSSKNVVYNNLGMKGPGHLDEPPVIRLDNTVSYDGQNLDLVMSIVEGKNFYEPSGINSVDASGIVVNVAFGSAADLEIHLCASKESHVALEHLYLQVSDLQEHGVDMLAADGEAIFRNFEAIQFPGKKWIAAEELRVGSQDDEEWLAPSGPAPVVFFQNQKQIRVILKAKPQGPFTGPGRRFLLRLHSTDVKEPPMPVKGRGSIPEPHNLHNAIASGKAPQLPSKMGIRLKMGHDNIRFNNLGGQGPGHLDEPPILRFDHTAMEILNGTHLSPVDVVIRAMSSYHPERSALNGRMAGDRASINVKVGTSVSLQISLLKPEESQHLKPLAVSALLVSIFDVEEPVHSLAADGEVEIGGFQAVLWPNGTSMLAMQLPHHQGVWSVPMGPAPSFYFHQTTEVTLRLNAKQGGGNALGSAVAGRSFFITLQSPDLEEVSGPVPALRGQTMASVRRTESTPSPGRQVTGGMDLDAFFPSNFGTKLLLSPHNVIYNNLGGYGPVHADPPVIRYHAACFQDGHPVDVVFHASSYHPGASGLNALLGHDYTASINVALNSSVTLLIGLRDAQDHALSLPRLYLSVSDTEGDQESSSSPGSVVADDFEAVQLSTGAWLTSAQLGEDWSADLGHKSPVIFTFWNKAQIALTLKASLKPGAAVAFDEGRTFFLSLWSPDVDVPDTKAHKVHKAGIKGRWQVPDLPEDMGPWLMLQRSKVISNNLGGLGPVLDEAHDDLRFAAVATSEEKPVDVVLHATGPYHPGIVALNGGAAEFTSLPHAVVNVALDTTLHLDLKVVKHQEVIPVPIEWLFLVIYDVEDPFPALSAAEVVVAGVQATLLPKGEWQAVKPEAQKAFRLAAGVAPLLAIRSSEVKLTLQPLRTTGNSLSPQGRSFFIALRADKNLEVLSSSLPHPVARLPHLSIPAGAPTTVTTTGAWRTTAVSKAKPSPEAAWLRQPLIQGFLGRYLALSPNQILVNNLAGAGPDRAAADLSMAAPEVRWRAGSIHGKPLDVVLRAVSTYVPRDVALNGREGRVPAATVNVAVGTSVKLRFDFLTVDSEGVSRETSLPRLYMQIFDEEEPRPALSMEREATVLDYEGISWSNGTWHPGGFGKSFSLPAGPSPTVAFTSCSSIHVALRARKGLGSALGSTWEGRTFSISLRSPDVIINTTAFAPGTSATSAALRHHWPPIALGGTFAGMQAANSSQVLHTAPAVAASAGVATAHGMRRWKLKPVEGPAKATEMTEPSARRWKLKPVEAPAVQATSTTKPSEKTNADSEPVAPVIATAAAPVLAASVATSTRMTSITATTLTWTSLTWTSITTSPPSSRTFTSVLPASSARMVPSAPMAALATRTYTSTTLTPTSVPTLTATAPPTRTITLSTITSTTISSTTMSSTTVIVLAPWQRAAVMSLETHATEVGVTMEVEHVDYQRLSWAASAAKQDLVEGLRQTLAWRAGLRQGHPIRVQDLDLSPGFQGSLLLRSTLSSKRPLDVAKLQSSFQSRIFQQDLFDAINSSEVAGAVRGPVRVRAVSVAPIMHVPGTAVQPTTEPVWKMMGLSGWHLSEVLLFMLFVLALCCLIPLLARFLTQSWSEPAVARAPPNTAPWGGPLESGDAWSSDAWSNYSERQADPWAGGLPIYEAERRGRADLGFSALGPPPRRPRSYEEEGSVAEAMLSPTPSYPSRHLSGSSATSPVPSQRNVAQGPQLLSDRDLGGSTGRLRRVSPVRFSSEVGLGAGSSRVSQAASIPPVVRARPLARSWLEDQGRPNLPVSEVIPSRYVDPLLLLPPSPGGAEVNRRRDLQVDYAGGRRGH